MKRMVLFLLLSTVACQKNSGNSNRPTTPPENFESFNKHFHSDSVFQLSRVAFPIDGKSIDGFDQHKWTKENWEFQREPVSANTSNEYRHSLIKNDSVVIEKLWIEASGFSFERRFKRINSKWFLVFCDDINL